jgi:hypothetical protein
VLCGDSLAADAHLLTALHVLRPLRAAGGGAALPPQPARDRAGALALAPVLATACERGDADAARALAHAALPRLKANRWRSDVRFVAGTTLRAGDGDDADADAAAALRGGVLGDSLLILILPEEVTSALWFPSSPFPLPAPSLESGAAADAASALSLAGARRAAGAQAPLLVALGKPAGEFIGGETMHEVREVLAAAACDALEAAAAAA